MTDRALDSSLALEVVKARPAPIFLIEGFFASETLRFWNGYGVLTVGGYDYTGSANLISVSEIPETQDLQAQGATFVLSGVPSALKSLALQGASEYTGRVCNLYFSALDDNNAVIGTPYKQYSGLMDQMEIEDDGKRLVIKLSSENKMIELKKTKVSRYTPEDQRRRFTGDKGMDFVPQMQDKELTWGKASPSG